MKTTILRPICVGMIALLCASLLPQRTFPQTPDSLSRRSGEWLQFQLLGGLGIYYIGNWGRASNFRVGIDASFSHTDNSGDGNSYSIYSSTSGSASSSSNVNQPEQKGTSYRVDISGLYAQDIAGYANSTLYCGAGPMTSYSYDRNSRSTPYVRTDPYGTTRETAANSDKSTTWGIGALAILGVKSQLLAHVSLSAEVSISALYQWTSQTSSSSYTSDYPAAGQSVSTGGSNSHSAGWSVSLNKIRIGLLIAL